MSEAREHQARIVRRNRLRLARGLWPLAFILPAVTAFLRGDPGGVVFLFNAALFTYIMVRQQWVANDDPQRIPARVAVTADTLEVGDRRIERARIRAGYRLPGEPPRVQLHLEGELLPLEIELDTPWEAERLLRDLGLAPHQSVVAFAATTAPPANPWRGLVWALPVIPFLAASMAGAVVWSWAFLILMLGVLLLGTRWRRRVYVGTDGVDVERGLRGNRFLRHDAIQNVREGRHGQRGFVTLELEGGDEQRIGFPDGPQMQAFVARLEEARRVAGDAPDAQAAEALARGDRDARDWLARLRAMVDLGSHRQQAVAPDHLWRILERPEAPATDRAAAAVALGERLDPPTRQRIARVAEATASPRLRVVLDAVKEGAEDEALAEALDDLAAEEPLTAKPR